MNQRWLARNGRGIALDVLVVVCNLFLLAPLARVLREGGQGFLAAGKDPGWKVSPDVGWLFLAVFVAYTVGIGLKRAARRARLNALAPGAHRPASIVLVFAVCALLVFHFFIFTCSSVGPTEAIPSSATAAFRSRADMWAQALTARRPRQRVRLLE